MTYGPDIMSRAALIFLSYRFSQGAIGAQNRLLLLLEERWAPTLFHRDGLTELRRAVRQLVGDYFLDDRLHPAAAVPWTNGAIGAAAKSDAVVTNELSALFRRFDRREELEAFSSDPVALLASLLHVEHGYLTRPCGRASGDDSLRVIRRGERRDPYHSVVAAHALLARPTGRAEYDSLFRLIGHDDILVDLTSADRDALERVVTSYVDHADLTPLERARLMDLKRAQV